jgi:hypothetical protein
MKRNIITNLNDFMNENKIENNNGDIYLLTSDGHRDSVQLAKYAKNESELIKLLDLYCDDFGNVLLIHTIKIDYARTLITYKYTDKYDKSENPETEDGKCEFFIIKSV